MRLLIVTAVDAERSAIRHRAPDLDVIVAGVGLAAAAAQTAFALARGEYEAVICAGIAGGFPGRAGIGDVVIGTRILAGDLGADSPDGFISVDELGFGTAELTADATLRDALIRSLPDARTGAVVSVNTVTGTAAGTAALSMRYPDAAAEGMEGFGVGTAASAAGLPFIEVRTVSNLVGPRDRSAWRIGEALAALGNVGAALDRLER